MNTSHFYDEVVKLQKKLSSYKGEAQDARAFSESLDILVANLIFIEEQGFEPGNMPLVQRLMSMLKGFNSDDLDFKLKPFAELIKRLSNRLLDGVVDQIVQASGVSHHRLMPNASDAQSTGVPYQHATKIPPSRWGMTPGAWSRGHQQFANRPSWAGSFDNPQFPGIDANAGSVNRNTSSEGFTDTSTQHGDFDQQWQVSLGISFTHLIGQIERKFHVQSPDQDRLLSVMKEDNDAEFLVRWLNSPHVRGLSEEMEVFYQAPELVPLIIPLFRLLLDDIYPDGPDEVVILNIMRLIPYIDFHVKK